MLIKIRFELTGFQLSFQNVTMNRNHVNTFISGGFIVGMYFFLFTGKRALTGGGVGVAYKRQLTV